MRYLNFQNHSDPTKTTGEAEQCFSILKLIKACNINKYKVM